MTKKENLNKYFENSKTTFSMQYGINTLNRVSKEILNSRSLMELTSSLKNKFFPTSEQITMVITKIDFINKSTIFFGKPSDSEIEKKLDFFHIAFIIILENWANNILPNQENIMPKLESIDDNKAKWLNNETGWSATEQLVKRVNEMYDELENELKK